MVRLIRGGPLKNQSGEQIIQNPSGQLPQQGNQETVQAPTGLKLLRGGRIVQQQPAQITAEQPVYQQIPQDYSLSQTDMSPEAIMRNRETAKRVGAGALGSFAQGATNMGELAGTVVGRGVEAIAKGITGAQDLPSALKGLPGDPSLYPGYNPNAEVEQKALQEEINKYQGKDAKQLVGESLGYDNLDPQSFGESFLQGVAHDLPNILLSAGVGSIGNKILSSVASNIGSSGAKGMGLGPIAQLAAGIGSQGAAQYLANRGPGGIAGDIKRASESLYRGWDKYASNARVDASPYLKAINTAEDIAKDSLGSIRKPLLKDINDIKNHISPPRTSPDTKDPKKLLEYLTGTNKDQPTYKAITSQLKKIGQGIGEAKNDTERKVYRKLYAEFSSILDQAAQNNPEVAKYLRAKNLDLAYNGQGLLRKFADRNKEIKDLIGGPVMRAIFGGIGGAGVGVGIGALTKAISTATPGGAALGVAGIVGGPFMARAINLIKQPEALKIIRDVYSSALFKDKIGIVNNLKELNNMVNKQ